MKEKRVIDIYTDGACSGNPGPGGWGFCFIATPSEGRLEQGNGGENSTTNNRMELTAVIEGLKKVTHDPNHPIEVTVVTDSQYVMKGMTEWIKGWKAKNWIGSNKKPVKNRDLWEQLDAIVSTIPGLQWRWVKGHSGNKWNEYVDQLAVSGIPKE